MYIVVRTIRIMIITCNVKPKYSLLLSPDGNITEWVWFHVYIHSQNIFLNIILAQLFQVAVELFCKSSSGGNFMGGRMFQYFFHFDMYLS